MFFWYMERWLHKFCPILCECSLLLGLWWICQSHLKFRPLLHDLVFDELMFTWSSRVLNDYFSVLFFLLARLIIYTVLLCGYREWLITYIRRVWWLFLALLQFFVIVILFISWGSINPIFHSVNHFLYIVIKIQLISDESLQKFETECLSFKSICFVLVPECFVLMLCDKFWELSCFGLGIYLWCLYSYLCSFIKFDNASHTIRFWIKIGYGLAADIAVADRWFHRLLA